MRTLAIACVLFTLTTSPSLAQDLGITLGGGRTWDDEGSLGNGGLIGASVYWPGERLALGVDVERLTHDRTTSAGGLRFRGTTWLASGNLAWRFGDPTVKPYVFVGGGVVLYDGTFEDRTFGLTELRESWSTTLSFGSGLDIAAGRHLSIRPEMRIYMAQPQDDWAPWSIIRGAVTIAWRR